MRRSSTNDDLSHPTSPSDRRCGHHHEDDGAYALVRIRDRSCRSRNKGEADQRSRPAAGGHIAGPARSRFDDEIPISGGTVLARARRGAIPLNRHLSDRIVSSANFGLVNALTDPVDGSIRIGGVDGMIEESLSRQVDSLVEILEAQKADFVRLLDHIGQGEAAVRSADVSLLLEICRDERVIAARLQELDRHRFNQVRRLKELLGPAKMDDPGMRTRDLCRHLPAALRSRIEPVVEQLRALAERPPAEVRFCVQPRRPCVDISEASSRQSIQVSRMVPRRMEDEDGSNRRKSFMPRSISGGARGREDGWIHDL